MANGMRVMDIGFMSLRGKLGDIEFNSCPLGMLEMERGVKHNSGEVSKSILLCLIVECGEKGIDILSRKGAINGVVEVFWIFCSSSSLSGL